MLEFSASFQEKIREESQADFIEKMKEFLRSSYGLKDYALYKNHTLTAQKSLKESNWSSELQAKYLDLPQDTFWNKGKKYFLTWSYQTQAILQKKSIPQILKKKELNRATSTLLQYGYLERNAVSPRWGLLCLKIFRELQCFEPILKPLFVHTSYTKKLFHALLSESFNQSFKDSLESEIIVAFKNKTSPKFIFEKEKQLFHAQLQEIPLSTKQDWNYIINFFALLYQLYQWNYAYLFSLFHFPSPEELAQENFWKNKEAAWASLEAQAQAVEIKTLLEPLIHIHSTVEALNQYPLCEKHFLALSTAYKMLLQEPDLILGENLFGQQWLKKTVLAHVGLQKNLSVLCTKPLIMHARQDLLYKEYPTNKHLEMEFSKNNPFYQHYLQTLFFNKHTLPYFKSIEKYLQNFYYQYLQSQLPTEFTKILEKHQLYLSNLESSTTNKQSSLGDSLNSFIGTFLQDCHRYISEKEWAYYQAMERFALNSQETFGQKNFLHLEAEFQKVLDLLHLKVAHIEEQSATKNALKACQTYTQTLQQILLNQRFAFLKKTPYLVELSEKNLSFFERTQKSISFFKEFLYIIELLRYHVVF